MPINGDLKSALVRRFGSQVHAAREIGIRENHVRGHVLPSQREPQAIERALGQPKMQRLLEDWR